MVVEKLDNNGQQYNKYLILISNIKIYDKYNKNDTPNFRKVTIQPTQRKNKD